MDDLRNSPIYKAHLDPSSYGPEDGTELKQLQSAELKRLLADAMLDNVVLKELLGKP